MKTKTSDRLPEHVAIIMDGNGRWANRRGLPRTFGHRQGVEALRAVIRHTDEIGIRALTVYAFSTENWKRSTEEVGALMGLLLEYFRRELDELNRKNVCIRILGDIDGIPEAFSRQKEALHHAVRRTQANTGLCLNIALNYGARQEILRACRELAEEAVQGKIDPESIDEAAFSRRLYTEGLPEVDLLIRTSGELRLSNFLLWQLAYTEFYVTDVLWPDFDVREYDSALAAYAERDRRYGGAREAKQ